MISKTSACILLATIALLCSCQSLKGKIGNASSPKKTSSVETPANSSDLSEFDAARTASFPNDPFKEKLRLGYLELFDYAKKNNNIDSAKRFGRKAMVTLSNLNPDMEGLYDRDIDLQTLNNLLGAKYFVESALEAGLKDSDPQTAAEAQLKFDCWAEQSTRKHNPSDNRPCKEEFDKANAKIITFMNAANERNEEQKLQLEAKVRAMTKEIDPRKMPEYSLIFFKFNSTELGVTAKGIIGKVAADIKLFKPKKVVISGNADKIGSYGSNMSLAMKRGQVVADYLVQNYNVDPSILDVKAYGLNNPRIDPEVSKKEVRNRYVQIIFLKDNKVYYEDNNNG